MPLNPFHSLLALIRKRVAGPHAKTNTTWNRMVACPQKLIHELRVLPAHGGLGDS